MNPPPSNFTISALTFVRPAVVLHVHERWRAGKHTEVTSRTFATPQGDEPFRMTGVLFVIEYLTMWRLSPFDIEVLRVLPSLRALDDGFWDYLSTVRLKGDVAGMPEGQQLGGLTYTASPAVRAFAGDRPDIPIMTIEDEAGFVALITEGVHALLECAVIHSREIAREQDRVGQSMFFHSERLGHPLTSMMTSTVQSVVGARSPLQRKNTLDLWFWWDTSKRGGEPTNGFWESFARFRAEYKQELNADVNVLIERNP